MLYHVLQTATGNSRNQWWLLYVWLRETSNKPCLCEWIYERSYIWTAEKDMNLWLILKLKHEKIQAWKNPVFGVKFVNKIMSLYWNNCITWNHQTLRILWIVNGDVCIPPVAYEARAYPGFCSMKQLGVFPPPPVQTLVLTQKQPTIGNWPASNQFEVWVLFHSICFVP